MIQYYYDYDYDFSKLFKEKNENKQINRCNNGLKRI